MIYLNSWQIMLQNRDAILIYRNLESLDCFSSNLNFEVSVVMNAKVLLYIRGAGCVLISDEYQEFCFI